jgi:hypothetical protein
VLFDLNKYILILKKQLQNNSTNLSAVKPVVKPDSLKTLPKTNMIPTTSTINWSEVKISELMLKSWIYQKQFRFYNPTNPNVCYNKAPYKR